MLFKKTEKYIETCGIADTIASAPAVLCAFSGGADSSALLRFLSIYLKNSDTKLYAAHVNHMIRGDDADSDEKFCENVCRELSVPLFVGKFDVPAEKEKTGETLEEAARRLRYAYLTETAEKLGAVIATAHNATDNAETVIFNLARGTSVKGLGGIAPVRKLGNVAVVRPLLCLTSEKIREYCKKENIPYVTDKTNSNTDYTRNYIRQNIIPCLREINPRSDEAFLRMSRTARDADGFISQTAIKTVSGRKYIPSEKFAALPSPVRAAVIQILCRNELKNNSVTEKNIADITDFALSGKVGSISVPGGKFFIHRDCVFAEKPREKSPDDTGMTPLELEKSTVFGDYLIFLSESPQKNPDFGENIYNLFIKTVVNRDIINSKLFVRCRLPGDTYRLHGMKKKLKKLLCDSKIPLRMRDSLPLVCDEEGILWVPFFPPRDGTAQKENGLYISIYRTEGKQ